MNILSAQEISKAILIADLTNGELNEIIRSLKTKQSMMNEASKKAFTVGQLVKFNSTRSGNIVKRRIKKINRKFIILLDETNVEWEVPAAMLSLQ